MTGHALSHPERQHLSTHRVLWPYTLDHIGVSEAQGCHLPCREAIS